MHRLRPRPCPERWWVSVAAEPYDPHTHGPRRERIDPELLAISRIIVVIAVLTALLWFINHVF
jgi:hypothetical protein